MLFATYVAVIFIIFFVSECVCWGEGWVGVDVCVLVGRPAFDGLSPLW